MRNWRPRSAQRPLDSRQAVRSAALPAAAATAHSMPVGISDTSVGHHAGTVSVNFTSQAYGGTGLTDTPLASQSLAVTGDVYGLRGPIRLTRRSIWAAFISATVLARGP